jgi:hypothetical protein
VAEVKGKMGQGILHGQEFFFWFFFPFPSWSGEKRPGTGMWGYMLTRTDRIIITEGLEG